ncbi:hypothetical protein [Brucella pituitosa]|uniref:hypothetical protein n=1 Tax=Brucella pituitosa TaxID=571256 RepID=UPI003F4ADD9C
MAKSSELTWHQRTAIVRVGNKKRPVLPSEIAELPSATRQTINLSSAHSTLRQLLKKELVRIVSVHPTQYCLTEEGLAIYHDDASEHNPGNCVSAAG